MYKQKKQLYNYIIILYNFLLFILTIIIIEIFININCKNVVKKKIIYGIKYKYQIL